MAPAIKEFASRDALMQACAQRIAEALQKAIAKRGSACAALSGGATPAPAYRRLGAMALEWSKVAFALVDERLVLPTDDASNAALVKSALASAFAAGAKFIPMVSEPHDIVAAADRANALYDSLPIDIAVMGMGLDGHTASWFPQADTLREALDLAPSRTVIAAHAPGAQGSAERLTLTRAALARAGAVILLISGPEKRARLEASLAGEWAPVTALFETGMPLPEIFWAA